MIDSKLAPVAAEADCHPYDWGSYICHKNLSSGFLTRVCTTTEDGLRLGISDLGSRGIVLSI